MRPPPIYRWKSFYLGILVLVFLSLAWARSIYAGEKVLVNCPPLGHFVFIGQSAGGAGVVCLDRGFGSPDLVCNYPIAGTETDLFSLWRNPHSSPSFEIPFPAGWESAANGWSVFVSHWLLILGFLNLWIAFLFWRSRRMGRLAIQNPWDPSPIPFK
jgi:hypothetical protein